MPRDCSCSWIDRSRTSFWGNLEGLGKGGTVLLFWYLGEVLVGEGFYPGTEAGPVQG